MFAKVSRRLLFSNRRTATNIIKYNDWLIDFNKKRSLLGTINLINKSFTSKDMESSKEPEVV